MKDIFCFTDIHGRWDLYQTIINYCKKQDPECSIIYLGDACDRGPDGYRIMKDLLTDPHVGYLKGNHENIFVNAAREIKENFQFPDISNREHLEKRILTANKFPFGYEKIKLCVYNDGLDSLLGWIQDGQPMDFIEQLDNLPLTFSYNKYDFCHAGSSYAQFKKVAEIEYNGGEPTWNEQCPLLWDRKNFDIGWAAGRICIHGHTPTPFMPTKYYGRDKSEKNAHPCAWIGDFDNKYSGLKLNMDTGATFTGRAYVINILTQQITGFFDPKIVNQQGEIYNLGSYYLKEKENE